MFFVKNPRAKRMETAEQTAASQILPFSKLTFANNHIRTMADVCETFRLFRVFSGLLTNIRVHSWFFISSSRQSL